MHENPFQMLTPRDIYDLADTVDTELLTRDGADLDLVSLEGGVVVEMSKTYICFANLAG